MEKFKNDSDFVLNITSNTMRYVRHFEEVADELMPPSTNPLLQGNNDIFDFLQVLREAHAVPAGLPTLHSESAQF